MVARPAVATAEDTAGDRQPQWRAGARRSQGGEVRALPPYAGYVWFEISFACPRGVLLAGGVAQQPARGVAERLGRARELRGRVRVDAPDPGSVHGAARRAGARRLPRRSWRHTEACHAGPHLVVIFQENVSFDHYFGTYPHAANLPGERPYADREGTPSVNGFTPFLRFYNPNLVNPIRLPPSQALTCDQDHAYTAEQKAYDGGLMDAFVQSTRATAAGCDPSSVMD